MTAEFGDKGKYREILKIDFTDNEEYQEFVKDLAECVAEEIQFNDELVEDIAYEIAYEITARHMSKLAEAVLEKLLAEFRKES